MNDSRAPAVRHLTATFLVMALSGCACSETGISGDTGVDGDTSVADTVEVEDGGYDPSIDPPDADTTPVDTTFGDFLEWDPHEDHVGEPGWRSSTEPFCREPDWGLSGWDVWSDHRGVFALVAESNPGPTICPPPTPEDAPGHNYLAFNDGTGWNLYIDTLVCEHRCWRALTGFPGGDLVLLKDTVPFEMCGPDGRVTEGPVTVEPSDLRDLFIVDETLAYGLQDYLLIYWDGESWGPYPPDPTPSEPRVVWADRASLFIGGQSGLIMSHEEGGWVIQDTGTLEDITDIWGFGPDDVWAGTRNGRILRKHDGVWNRMEWPRLSTGCTSTEEIQEFWGADGVLYAWTNHDLILWDGAEFVNILNFPCGEPPRWITGIWGNAPDEVFVSVHDETWATDGCDPTILLWWDGTHFHKF